MKFQYRTRSETLKLMLIGPGANKTQFHAALRRALPLCPGLEETQNRLPPHRSSTRETRSISLAALHYRCSALHMIWAYNPAPSTVFMDQNDLDD